MGLKVCICEMCARILWLTNSARSFWEQYKRAHLVSECACVCNHHHWRISMIVVDAVGDMNVCVCLFIRSLAAVMHTYYVLKSIHTHAHSTLTDDMCIYAYLSYVFSQIKNTYAITYPAANTYQAHNGCWLKCTLILNVNNCLIV